MTAIPPDASLLRELQDAPGRIVLGQLGQLRRRLRFVLAVRYSWLAVIGAVMASAIVVMASGGTRRGAVVLLIASAAAALAVGLAIALVRTPSLGDTAIAVDRNRSLEDRAAAALAFVGHADPVATLVVRDAAQHLQRLVPAAVFPLDRPGRKTQAGAVAASLLFIVVLTRNSADERRAPSGGSQPGAAGASNARPAPGHAVAPSPAAGARRAAEGTAAPAADAATPARVQAPAPAALSSRTDAIAPSSARGAPSPARSAEGPERASTGTGAELRAPAAGDSRRSPAAGGDTSTPRGRATAAGADGPGGRGSAAGASASTASGRGGGTQGGPLARGNDRITDRLTPGGPGYDPRYRAALARAQAALAQERVPASLRAYVRDYFEAIRSPRQP